MQCRNWSIRAAPVVLLVFVGNVIPENKLRRSNLRRHNQPSELRLRRNRWVQRFGAATGSNDRRRHLNGVRWLSVARRSL